jgi:hypothetical protein
MRNPLKSGMTFCDSTSTEWLREVLNQICMNYTIGLDLALKLRLALICCQYGRESAKCDEFHTFCTLIRALYDKNGVFL